MDYKLTEEVLEMFASLTHAFGLAAGRKSAYQKNIELYIKEYGEVLLRGLTPEEILRGLDPETREKLKQLIRAQDEKQS